MRIRFKPLSELFEIPKKAHEDDACYDLKVTSVKNTLFKSTVYFGFAAEFGSNWIGDIRPRSSIHKRFLLLSNSPGTIDAGFRGEWRAVFYKLPFVSKPYKIGERAVQFRMAPKFEPEFEKVKELSISLRDIGGFGSTGK